MSIRFFRRLFILPWLNLNLSKRGASVSVGPRGANFTVGTSGAQVTAGIPGTGLSMTRRWPWRTRRQTLARLQQFLRGLRSVLNNPHATLVEYHDALDQQRILGLSDEDLGPETLETVRSIREMLADMERDLSKVRPITI